jgi:hypothetical protein
MASSSASAGPKLSWTAVLDAHDAEVAGRTGARRFAWPMDQFKRPVHDPRSSSRTSVSVTVLWFALVVAFSGVILHRHIHRPWVTNLKLVPVKSLPPMPLALNTLCSEGWACLPGAQSIPGAFQLGPCRYEAPYNRTYSCPDMFPNAMDATDGFGRGRRKLLHDHLWTWHWTTRVTQKYNGTNAQGCARERVAAADSWHAEWSVLELDDKRASNHFDSALLLTLASDTNRTVDLLFDAFDADGDGVVSGDDESGFGTVFSRVMLALANHGDYHEGNASWIGGYKSFDELNNVDAVLADDTATVDQLSAYFDAFGGGACLTPAGAPCATVDEFKAAIAQVWVNAQASYAYFFENYEAITGESMAWHPWTAILRGDPFYANTSVGIDGFPKDGVVTRFELREAFRYALFHGTVTEWTLAQTAMLALGDGAYPEAAQRAPLELCDVETAAGDDALGGILLETDFPAGCPYGAADCNTRLSVELGSFPDAGDNDSPVFMQSLDLEPGQRKAVQVGVTVIRKPGQADTYELRAADLFYVGKNDDRRASLRVGLKPYAEVLETSRPGDFVTVFSAIGGFASLSLSLLGMAVGAISSVLASGDDLGAGGILAS